MENLSESSFIVNRRENGWTYTEGVINDRMDFFSPSPNKNNKYPSALSAGADRLSWAGQLLSETFRAGSPPRLHTVSLPVHRGTICSPSQISRHPDKLRDGLSSPTTNVAISIRQLRAQPVFFFYSPCDSWGAILEGCLDFVQGGQSDGGPGGCSIPVSPCSRRK